MSYEPGPGALI